MFGILDDLKIVSGLAIGLVVYHLYASLIGYPSAAREAREGYVLLAEKTAAQATVAELQRQLQASNSAKQSLQEKITKDTAEDVQREKDREAKILEYEVRLSQANRRCALDRADIDAILHD
ncbi:hypothetical protein ACFFP0_24485 [Rhizobium puerariae]|uniref:Uncharacterized protein n=1 Tax=Rhizobium puerariae TaxID=1585791 RepID=A0ABV6AN30_9HYPH